MSMSDLRVLCVDDFPLSTTRPRIMAGFESFIAKLMNDSMGEVKADCWVDGSFLTKNINPVDIDFVLKVDGEQYDAAPSHLRDALDWADKDHRSDYYCDSHLLTTYPVGHVLHEETEWFRVYWHKTYGWSRDNIDTKGIAVIKIGSTE